MELIYYGEDKSYTRVNDIKFLGMIDDELFASLYKHPRRMARRIVSAKKSDFEDIVLNSEVLNKRLCFLQNKRKLIVTERLEMVYACVYKSTVADLLEASLSVKDSKNVITVSLE